MAPDSPGTAASSPDSAIKRRRPPSAPGGQIVVAPPASARPAGTLRRPFTARANSDREKVPAPGVADLLAALARGDTLPYSDAVGMDKVAVNTVLECLEVAMLKLEMERHPRTLVGSTFLTKTLPAALEAAKYHLQNSNQMKIDGMHDAEVLQDQLRTQARQLESQLVQIRKHAKVHRSQARQLYEVRQKLDGEVGDLQGRLNAFRDESMHLQKIIDDSLRNEREAFEQDRAQLKAQRADLQDQLRNAKEQLPLAKSRMDAAQKSEDRTRAEIDAAKSDAESAGRFKAELKERTDEAVSLARQVQNLEFATKKKKKRGKK